MKKINDNKNWKMLVLYTLKNSTFEKAKNIERFIITLTKP